MTRVKVHSCELESYLYTIIEVLKYNPEPSPINQKFCREKY